MHGNTAALKTLVADINRRYTEFRAAIPLSWHPVRREMLIVTRFADAPQIHWVERPQGARTQLTFADESVTYASYEPGTGKYFLFTRDVGGDEFPLGDGQPFLFGRADA